MVLKGEPSRLGGYPLLFDPQFQLVLLLASALGLSINHSTFVCTRVNEPLMTSVAGGWMGGGEFRAAKGYWSVWSGKLGTGVLAIGA